MSISSADIHKALNSVWNASTLDSLFKALWLTSVTNSEWSVLNEQEASPNQPFPYCVYDISGGATTNRMSNEANSISEIHDVPIEFQVQARTVSGDSRTAKGIAAYLVEEIMKVFGGHPTTRPTGLTLDNGYFLFAEYASDYSVRTGDDEYSWTIAYLARLDVPVAV